ncbi:hypothetical protein SAURM35S_00603 [Streptomyces aurantiogriseus]
MTADDTVPFAVRSAARHPDDLVLEPLPGGGRRR